MSRGIAQDPVVTRSGNTKIVQPQMVQGLSVAIDPFCRQQSGDVTVVPEIPPTG